MVLYTRRDYTAGKYGIKMERMDRVRPRKESRCGCLKMNPSVLFLAWIAVSLAAFGYGNVADARLTKKHDVFLDAEIRLVTEKGTPLANFPLAVHDPYTAHRKYGDAIKTATDNNGKYPLQRFWNRFENNAFAPPILAPFAKTELRSAISLTFYLPTLHKYGEHSVLFVLGQPSEELWQQLQRDRPQDVPVKIPPNKSGGINQPSKFTHGAYYHAYGGQLKLAQVIANGKDVRRVPMTPRGDTPLVKKIPIPADPRVQITARATPLADERQGWRLEITLVVPEKNTGKN